MGIRSVNVARLTYLLFCELAGVLIALSTKDSEVFSISVYQGLIGGLVVAALFIFMETLMKGFSLRGFSTATFGLLVGLLCAWLLTLVGMDDLIANAFDSAAEMVALTTRVIIFSTLGFIGAALALRSAREDFAFIIPYVRFRSDSLGGRPLLLDATAVFDGRVSNLVQTGFLPSNIVIPDFELEKIQSLSEDSDPKLARRGKYGLSELEKLRNLDGCDVRIHDLAGEIEEEDRRENRVIQVARLLGARLLTVSDDQAQMARLKNVEALNLNELVDALAKDVQVGQKLRIYLVKTGRDEHQGVGYTQDGTMIVVNHAVEKIGTTCSVMIVGNLDTSSGTLFFAELI